MAAARLARTRKHAFRYKEGPEGTDTNSNMFSEENIGSKHRDERRYLDVPPFEYVTMPAATRKETATAMTLFYVRCFRVRYNR